MNTSSAGGHHDHRFHGTHYVVSEDVDILISRWCKSKKLQPPAKKFYAPLRLRMKKFLQGIFSRVTFIGSQEIRSGLLKSIAQYKKAGLTVVSLERAYLEDSEIHGRIELTRTVDERGNDVVVPSVRNGAPSREIQFKSLHGEKIALVDDVVFSGKTIIDTITTLHHYHANVHAVVAAVGVKDGIDNLKRTYFGVIGMPECLTVDCLDEFDDVSDQVCERDFYPGIPYSGREYFCGDGSFPYVLPFGLPGKWASIPEKELARFSAICIGNTIALFEEIERINHIKITCAMVPRPIFGFPKNRERFVPLLQTKMPNV